MTRTGEEVSRFLSDLSDREGWIAAFEPPTFDSLPPFDHWRVGVPTVPIVAPLEQLFNTDAGAFEML